MHTNQRFAPVRVVAILFEPAVIAHAIFKELRDELECAEPRPGEKEA